MAAKKTRRPEFDEQPRTLPLDGYTRWDLLKLFVPKSHESVRQLERAGRFPKRVQLGSARCVGWPNREIHKWLADPSGYRVEADEPAAA